MSDEMTAHERAMIYNALTSAMLDSGAIDDARMNDFLALNIPKYEVFTKADGVEIVIGKSGPASGMVARDFILKHQRNLTPHMFPQAVTLPENEQLISDAFGLASGKPSLTALGALWRSVGAFSFAELCKSHGFDPKRPTIAGRAPDGTGGDKPKPKASRSPWSPEGWSFAEQTRLVRTLGVEKASQMATSAGSFLGATKPNSKKMVGRAFGDF
jgi:hypothetical protein